MGDDTSTNELIQKKWNRVYSEQASDKSLGEPALVLTENQHLIPVQGRALDIACGRGVNARYLAEHGLDVDAWDISDVAIDNLQNEANRANLPIRATCLDINSSMLSTRQWDVIVICHYLDRQLMPAVRAALAPSGLLFMQTFTADKRVALGPSSPRFLLEHDELLNMTQGLQMLTYRNEGANPDAQAPLAGRAYVVASA